MGTTRLYESSIHTSRPTFSYHSLLPQRPPRHSSSTVRPELPHTQRNLSWILQRDVSMTDLFPRSDYRSDHASLPSPTPPPTPTSGEAERPRRRRERGSRRRSGVGRHESRDGTHGPGGPFNQDQGQDPVRCVVFYYVGRGGRSLNGRLVLLFVCTRVSVRTPQTHGTPETYLYLGPSRTLLDLPDPWSL